MSFWPYVVTIEELGNKADVDLLVVSSVMFLSDVYTQFHRNQARPFITEFSVKSWCFFVSADISSTSSRLVNTS